MVLLERTCVIPSTRGSYNCICNSGPGGCFALICPPRAQYAHSAQTHMQTEHPCTWNENQSQKAFLRWEEPYKVIPSHTGMSSGAVFIQIFFKWSYYSWVQDSWQIDTLVLWIIQCFLFLSSVASLNLRYRIVDASVDLWSIVLCILTSWGFL